jgi:hypothetical protein
MDEPRRIELTSYDYDGARMPHAASALEGV